MEAARGAGNQHRAWLPQSEIMKTKKPSASAPAFSALDLIMTIAGVLICAWILLPLIAGSKPRVTRITCISNIKQVGIGFRLYASDGKPYPRYNPTNEVWRYFQVPGKEIGSPKVLLCPQDSARTKPAFDFEMPETINSFAHPKFQNKALSYFYGTEVDETLPDSILAGDRNLSTNKQILTGVLILNTNSPARWTKEIHKDAGNIVFGDGSARETSTGHLRGILALQTNETQRLVLP